jgi:urease accessory protein
MTDLPPATEVIPATKRGPILPYDLVVLGYDQRFLRRKRLVTVHEEGFLVDLPETVNIVEGDCFRLTDGRLIEVISAEEKLLAVTGDLPRLAWHIGNRHTPCQIEAGRLLIREDHVLEAMLRQLGATVTKVREPFTPEGGAYGHGRTMGHDHGPHGFGQQQSAHGHDDASGDPA